MLGLTGGEGEDEFFVVGGEDEGFEGSGVPVDVGDVVDEEFEPFFVLEGVAVE